MQTLTVQKYRGICDLAGFRFAALCKYWAKHPNNAQRYEKYLTTLFQYQLKLRKDCADISLHDDLANWPLHFSRRIDCFRALTCLYDLKFDMGIYLEFLEFILENIQPTCSRVLNTFQLTEIGFVINEVKKHTSKGSPFRHRARKLLGIAEAEYNILSEDCSSLSFLYYRFHYLRQDMAAILKQDFYSGSLRYAFWEKLCSGNSDYTRHDAVWLDKMSNALEKSVCKSWTQEEWSCNSLLFLKELLIDIFFAANEVADGPNELPEAFRKGIGLLVRCDEAEFLMNSAEAAYQKLSELACNEFAPTWVFKCLDEADILRSNSQVLVTPLATQKEFFALF